MFYIDSFVIIMKFYYFCTCITSISRDFAKLQERNIVKRHGADNDGYWEVII